MCFLCLGVSNPLSEEEGKFRDQAHTFCSSPRDHNYPHRAIQTPRFENAMQYKIDVCKALEYGMIIPNCMC